jgi:carotenoid cleavage dioxygenase-like enzyme
MTAHPKVDPVTGELVFFGYDIMSSQVHYNVADKNGVLVRHLTIPTPCGSMMHDMCLAGEWSLLFDMRLEFQLQNLAEGKNPWVHRLDLPARFGVLPRLATSPDAIKWWVARLLRRLLRQ